MSARRQWACVMLALFALLLVAPRADAVVREVSVGNYYFEDDAVHDRARLDAQQGDQLRFTVREAAYPPHSVNVDELDIHSGDLLLFDTFTTPPLSRPGVYRLYCKVHTDRGHITKLYVHAAPATTTTTTRTTTTVRGGSGATTSTVGTTTTSPAPVSSEPTTLAVPPDAATADPSAPTTLAPVGVGKATDRRRAEARPGSLAAVLGRRPADPGPWTRAVRLGAAVTALLLAIVVATLAWAYRPRDDEVEGHGTRNASREPPRGG